MSHKKFKNEIVWKNERRTPYNMHTLTKLIVFRSPFFFLDFLKIYKNEIFYANKITIDLMKPK